MAVHGLVQGFPDGSFSLQAPITQGEFANRLADLLVANSLPPVAITLALCTGPKSSQENHPAFALRKKPVLILPAKVTPAGTWDLNTGPMARFSKSWFTQAG
ncbi:MAG: S-layer homology domain-containing protein [Nodosilinea sp.]